MFVKEIGLRENVIREKFEKFGFFEGKIEKIFEVVEKLMGVLFGKFDSVII